MTSLPHEIVEMILQRARASHIRTFCMTTRGYSHFCKSKSFWHRALMTRYPFFTQIEESLSIFGVSPENAFLQLDRSLEMDSTLLEMVFAIKDHLLVDLTVAVWLDQIARDGALDLFILFGMQTKIFRGIEDDQEVYLTFLQFLQRIVGHLKESQEELFERWVYRESLPLSNILVIYSSSLVDWSRPIWKKLLLDALEYQFENEDDPGLMKVADPVLLTLTKMDEGEVLIRLMRDPRFYGDGENIIPDAAESIREFFNLALRYAFKAKKLRALKAMLYEDDLIEDFEDTVDEFLHQSIDIVNESGDRTLFELLEGMFAMNVTEEMYKRLPYSPEFSF